MVAVLINSPYATKCPKRKSSVLGDNSLLILFIVVVIVYITLITDPLRIQPWSQDRRNQTKSNRKSEISRESGQKRTDKKVVSKGHRRELKQKIKIENRKHKQNHTNSRNKLEATA